MKYLIASDIHGSAYFCKKMIEAFELEKADKILLLGDILYHGPRNDLPKEYEPKQVISLLNNLKNRIFCVRGNCDTEVDQMVLEFPILADYCLISYNLTTVFATHGHKFNPSNLPPLNCGDILLNGHTHIPKCEPIENIIYLNPGSVSIPKDNSYHGYMTFENGKFVWKDFENNIYNTFEIK